MYPSPQTQPCEEETAKKEKQRTHLKFNGLLVLVRTKTKWCNPKQSLSLYSDVELRTEWDEGHHTTRERERETHTHTYKQTHEVRGQKNKTLSRGDESFFSSKYVPSIKHHPSDETVHLSPGFLPRQITVVNNWVDSFSSRGVGTRVERIYPFSIYLWVSGFFSLPICLPIGKGYIIFF